MLEKEIFDVKLDDARIGVSLWNLQGPLYSSGGGDVFKAASVIKLAILIELFRRFAAGGLNPEQRLEVHPEDIVDGGFLCEAGAGREFSLRELARIMICASDNTASNMLVNLLGMEAVNKAAAEAGAEKTVLRRLFMYPPVNGENETCAEDCVKLLRCIYSGALFGEPFRSEALEMLRRQMFIEKIPARLPASWKIGNKTGELDGIRHDAAIIETDAGEVLFLAILTESSEAPWKIDFEIGRLAEKLCAKFKPAANI